jgi:hypothetical protein
MRVIRPVGARAWLAAAAAVCLLAPPLHGAQDPVSSSLRTLLVGGGPDRTHNQVAIESNVRYVGRLLPARSLVHVLFTDGDARSENVQYRGDDMQFAYRTPDLPRLDGPAEAASVRAELGAIAADARTQPSLTALLYFTGHGSPNYSSRYTDNAFDLWGSQRMTVRDLSVALRSFPPSATIALVMVQCYSGAFGNVLFDDGNPSGAPIEQHLAGFFAAEPQRVAAGCTAGINEADYKDFTGYFFAALSGLDRMGKPVTGADYDHDGHVGMNEAFAYALLNDVSVDTPVCTSDTFLRRFVDLPDADIFDVPYAKVEAWASPAQLVALDGLSMQLDLDGESRLVAAFNASQRIRTNNTSPRDARLIRFVELARSIVLAHALGESGDERLKVRFAELLNAEGGNPLR